MAAHSFNGCLHYFAQIAPLGPEAGRDRLTGLGKNNKTKHCILRNFESDCIRVTVKVTDPPGAQTRPLPKFFFEHLVTYIYIFGGLVGPKLHLTFS